MTLTTRLSVFFLSALAVVLVGFSVSLYLLARGHLLRQADERCRAALDTLAAAAEVEPEGVEWDPHGRSLVPVRHVEDGPVRWTVRAPEKGVLEASADAVDDRPLPEFEGNEGRPFEHTDADGRRWHVAVRRIAAPAGAVPTAAPGPKLHPALVLTAAVPVGPIDATLTRLAATLAALTTTVLGVALVVSRRACRRALAPVVRMADSARAIGTADLSDRLPVSPTADELADLGGAFNDLLDRLVVAFERERRFAGEASHQLRTPLTGLIGQVEVALRRERPADEYRRVLESVQSQAGRLRRVVEALLFLARSEAEAELPGLERIDLAAWVPQRLRAWAAHPRAGDLTFEAAGAAVVAAIHPDLFGELLDGLLDNALKYSRPGMPVNVRIGPTWIEVEDRGCGVGADELPHLFRPFFRSDAARRLGVAGSGLGLAVAARIAAALGGSISVESSPDKGSRFRVTLPSA